ncbi:MAG TPA: DUF1206 domain-containing protein [Ktedonobacterales bacterium]|nr:DUF1206 domain-containing protein [Ktedonobacterales bacterium]
MADSMASSSRNSRFDTGNVKGAAREAKQAARHTARSPIAQFLARLGYAAKGLVYFLLGVLTLEAVFGKHAASTDRNDVIRAIHNHAFGSVILAVIAVGLFGYALWCLALAIFDMDGYGTNAKGVFTRIGYAVVGLSYIGLALAAAKLDSGSGNGGKSTNTNAHDWTARLLAHSWGVAVVIIAGLVVLGVAAALAQQAYKAAFMRTMQSGQMSQTVRKAVKFTGRLGLSALSVVFAIIGLFLIVAAAHRNPNQAKGLGGALQELINQPFGHALLFVVALGVIAYGLYSFAEARYRRIGAAA